MLATPRVVLQAVHTILALPVVSTALEERVPQRGDMHHTTVLMLGFLEHVMIPSTQAVTAGRLLFAWMTIQDVVITLNTQTRQQNETTVITAPQQSMNCCKHLALQHTDVNSAFASQGLCYCSKDANRGSCMVNFLKNHPLTANGGQAQMYMVSNPRFLTNVKYPCKI